MDNLYSSSLQLFQNILGLGPTTGNIFTFPYPTISGATFTAGLAVPVTNFSIHTPRDDSHFDANPTGLNFCNVTLTYTHPGQDDSINVKIFLPAQDAWNARFVGTGGSAFGPGGFNSELAFAISQAYAAAGTDGGHYGDEFNSGDSLTSAESWANVSPGNVNLYRLQNLGSICLNDMTIVGKAVTASYFGKQAKMGSSSGMDSTRPVNSVLVSP